MHFFEMALDWAGRFDWAKVVVPILVSLIVFWLLARNIRKLVEQAVGPEGQLQSSMNEALGAFRVDLRQMLAEERRRHKVSLIKDARNIERSADDERRKLAIAADAAASPQLMQDDEDHEGLERNWGELSEMWKRVWTWTKQQLEFALANEKRGRVIGKLREANLKSPADLISMLYRYGWYGDESSDLALEMAGLFNRHRTKKLPVDSGTVEKFRKLYARWDAIDV